MSQGSYTVRFLGYLDFWIGTDLSGEAKRKYCVLHQNSGSSLARLDLYSSEEDFHKGGKGSTLLYCKQIQEITRCYGGRHSFKLKTEQADSSFTFACKFAAELEIWLGAFHDVMKDMPVMAEPDYGTINRTARRATVDNSTTSSSLKNNDKQAPHRSSSDKQPRRGSADDQKKPYESLDTRTLGVYQVTIVETDASKNWNLTGSYRLQITNKDLLLKNLDLEQPVLVWPFDLIRKFGYSDKIFKLEAGRRADSGQGTFTFGTSRGEEMLALIQEACKNSVCT